MAVLASGLSVVVTSSRGQVTQLRNAATAPAGQLNLKTKQLKNLRLDRSRVKFVICGNINSVSDPHKPECGSASKVLS